MCRDWRPSPVNEHVVATPTARSPVQSRIHRAALGLYAEKGSSQITVSELAAAAGIARNTIYNNFASPEALFETVAAVLVNEMNERVSATFDAAEDPARWLANGMRFYLRRAHEEPQWGRFVVGFGLANAGLQQLWSGPPTADVLLGIERGRYRISADQVLGAMAMIAGTVLASMLLVLEGHRTWRDAGTDAADLVLRGMGLSEEEACAIARSELPPLPDLPAKARRVSG